ncbi:MAG: polyisoprenoid-binding protein, partial [Gammaproteobacteria bacterium]
MLKKSLLAVALVFASSGAFAAAETYVMDNHHTQVEFSWNHFGFSNPVANFDQIEGSINYDADDITKSSVEATITTASINSHVKDLDEHLSSA